MTANRSQLLSWCLFVALMALVVWAGDRLNSRRAAAVAATENLATCRLIARQIAELRGRTGQSTSISRSAYDLPRRIESAALAAALSTDHIVRIDPLVSRPLGDTGYEQHPTSLQLRQVSLKQLGTFLSAITRNESGLEISSLRLSSSPREPLLPTGDEAWQAEVTLSYLAVSNTGVRADTEKTGARLE